MQTSIFIRFLFLCLFPWTVLSQTDNSELQKMYNEDQNSRSVKDIDWIILSKQDKEREKRVYELISSGKVVTGKDYYNSAMIFQHGNDTLASSMAVSQMRKAIELDSTINKWLLAAAIDRDLMRREKPQIYGTQYVRYNGEAKWKRYTIDTTKVTDEERKYYRVETLSEQLEKERNMNLMSISGFYSKSNSIKQTITLIKTENKKGVESTYNISEDELNSFGYELMNTNKENEALEVFTLNTKLYPNSFNTFDSLGECLLLLGKKEAGIKAYKKSLELNPKNDNAREVINKGK
ncbi:tetratricopeptide repeat protein [Flavobacterium sp. '19STA2R22 D10 B1']|uniref:tetratricopeptide repeat protein n=1 Tax=Flavobacterium aerium TaxID=3037261 RepID=UPI00278C29F4|nr:tetratricopeptide repeat protein [Flavobacterium sp. '19STA2R22 D10 B1']